jgi:hypothetical protein
MQLVVGGSSVRTVCGRGGGDVRTDSPAERFAAGSVLATDPAACRSAHHRSVRPHQGRSW